MNPNIPKSETADAPVLTGPRKIGAIPLSNGNITIHEVTPDGMKQARVVRPHIPAAHVTGEEFYKQKDNFDSEHAAWLEANRGSEAYNAQFAPPEERAVSSPEQNSGQ